jgi:hypothetical protein
MLTSFSPGRRRSKRRRRRRSSSRGSFTAFALRLPFPFLHVLLKSPRRKEEEIEQGGGV